MDPQHRRFITYDPLLTYSNSENRNFVDASGRMEIEGNEDTETLFNIGSDAYRRLSCPTKDDFESGLQDYYTFIENCRNNLIELHAESSFITTNKFGEKISVDWDEVDNEIILATIWQFRSKGYLSNEVDELLPQMYIYHAFIEIDFALMDLTIFREGGAVSSAINAANALSNAISLIYGNERLKDARREMAYKGARARIEQDPRQEERKWVYERWLAWQENPKEFESKADFARTVIKHCEHLKSTKKIEDWCREWEKEKRP